VLALFARAFAIDGSSSQCAVDKPHVNKLILQFINNF